MNYFLNLNSLDTLSSPGTAGKAVRVSLNKRNEERQKRKYPIPFRTQNRKANAQVSSFRDGSIGKQDGYLSMGFGDRLPGLHS